MIVFPQQKSTITYQVLGCVDSDGGHVLTVLTYELLDDIGDIIILRLSDDVQELLHDESHVWFHVLLG